MSLLPEGLGLRDRVKFSVLDWLFLSTEVLQGVSLIFFRLGFGVFNP